MDYQALQNELTEINRIAYEMPREQPGGMIPLDKKAWKKLDKSGEKIMKKIQEYDEFWIKHIKIKGRTYTTRQIWDEKINIKFIDLKIENN